MYKVFLSVARPNFKKLSTGELMMLKIWRGRALASIFSKNCHLVTYTNDDEPFTSDIFISSSTPLQNLHQLLSNCIVNCVKQHVSSFFFFV